MSSRVVWLQANELGLNIGSGKYHDPREGWTNVDLKHPGADVSGDFRDLSFASGFAQIRMIHVLEHIPWRDVDSELERVAGWLVPGGELTVEVPDMGRIMERGGEGFGVPWQQAIYGEGSEGEQHLGGFKSGELEVAIERAGLELVSAHVFFSDVVGREGLPCLEAVGRKGS